jgi:hypothetical protein
VCVTGSSLDAENVALHFQDGHVEGSSSEIEDQHVLGRFGVLVKTVGDSSGGGFVDDSEDLKTSNGTGIPGSETLRVVEVGRNAAEVSLSVADIT